MASRISREALFMREAYLYSLRSTCKRGQVGAVIVMDGKHSVIHGYNGAPPGQEECFEVGCDLRHGDELGCQRTTHAEANAVARAAFLGIQVRDGTMYCTYSPCHTCAKLLVAAGIRRLVYDRPYRATPWEDMKHKKLFGLEVVPVGTIIDIREVREVASED